MVEFEDLSEEDKKKLMEEAKGKKKKKKRPIRSVFIPLGSDYNARFNLWDTNLQIVKSHKEDDEWEQYDKINLSKRLMIELGSRIPTFIAEIEEKEQEKKG